MSTSKYLLPLCCVLCAFALLLTIVFSCGAAEPFLARSSAAYEQGLFDYSSVHSIDIVMEDWDSFIETCENEEYAAATVVIDGNSVGNVGIRAKGNTSLSNVSSMDSDRYSFKIEFDQYEDGKNYQGLDKLVLNNLIQDNTMMKDFLTYQLMGQFGVAAPLCSYAYLTVNGEDWGLYLALEAVEDSFLQRNYGNDFGDLYKPDSMSMGGGRGNGKEFDFENFNAEDFDFSQFKPENAPQMPEGTTPPEGFGRGNGTQQSEGEERGNRGGGFGGDFGGGMGSSDVKLQYIDDEPDSYSNIFDSAKTPVSDADQTRLIASLKSLSQYENLDSVLDIEAVLRYFVVHNFVVNGDSYTGSMIHNYYLYEQDGLLSMIPWDYNLAFGSFQSSSAKSAVNDPIDSPLSVSEDRPMAYWIFTSEDYTQQYHQYFSEFLQQFFSDGQAEQLIRSTAELISPYVEKDPSKFCTMEDFELAVETLSRFCQLRADSVQGQLDGSIPSTSEGQNKDSASLIDCGDLTLSDMGSMGMGGGRGGFDQQNPQAPMGAERPSRGNTAQSEGVSAETAAPKTEQSFEQRNPQLQSTQNSSYGILIGSFVVLLAGLLIAVGFRRR